MARETLVDKCVVRVQQVDDAAIFADDAVEEHLGFDTERLTQVVIEVREHLRRRRGARQVAQLQPLASEVLDELTRPRVRHHAANLRFEHLGI